MWGGSIDAAAQGEEALSGPGDKNGPDEGPGDRDPADEQPEPIGHP